MADPRHTPPPRAWTVVAEPCGTAAERENAVRMLRRMIAEWSAKRREPPEA
ncbi:MAG TPA: hypothetical protein VK464_14895 [Symbiobacteriaceae bacterium]|nr:hypothetical protein [Symbiobacteriaceae bacterium]